MAKLYFELGDYQQASLEARRVQERYETSPFVDDAALLEAQSVGMMEGRAADAFRLLQGLVDGYPDSDLVPHALYELGKVKAEQGEREGAIEISGSRARTSPRSAADREQHHPGCAGKSPNATRWAWATARWRSRRGRFRRTARWSSIGPPSRPRAEARTKRRASGATDADQWCVAGLGFSIGCSWNSFVRA